MEKQKQLRLVLGESSILAHNVMMKHDTESGILSVRRGDI